MEYQEAKEFIRANGIEGVLIELLMSPRLKVGPHTMESNITANKWGVSGQERTTAEMPVSSQLDQQDTQSGRVELDSGCVHDWMIVGNQTSLDLRSYEVRAICRNKYCHASWYSGLIPVQDVVPILSISQKQELKQSVPDESRVESTSSEPVEGRMGYR